jgi:hypothetical protein
VLAHNWIFCQVLRSAVEYDFDPTEMMFHRRLAIQTVRGSIEQLQVRFLHHDMVPVYLHFPHST